MKRGTIMANARGEDRSVPANQPGKGSLPRRQFLLSGLGAVAAGLVFPRATGATKAENPPAGWIDGHSRFTTPNWVRIFEEKSRRGLFNADNALPSARAWSPSK